MTSDSQVPQPRSSTEQVDPRYEDLDSWTAAEMIAAMFDGQVSAVAEVGSALPAIAAAVDGSVAGLQRGGRIIYAGAGTSGRIAVQDGAELTPTFDWPAERVVFLLAGGMSALTQSVEGAEDRASDATQAVEGAGLTIDDVLIAVAASGATPYTVAAVQAANKSGAVTIGVANNPDSPLLANARYPILVETGAEVIAGSTRMKAGTAQKVVLNLLSTAMMARMARVYRGLMVHLRVRNAKLERRGRAIIAAIAPCSDEEAARHLEQAKGDVKSAILLAFGLNGGEAASLLERHQGNLRAVLQEIGRGNA
ncbi:MAG: N-acetylmuramic acid 6-phosphate etherase [Alphaproteobacteria bacterium]|nr:N-acetylmuramic acid 6-phosphate etherase [Alphaproteobacteria bacterium]